MKPLFLALALFSIPAHAAEINSVVLPVRATIIQCGPRAKLVEACMKDERCCGLIEPAAGSEHETENPDNLQYEIEQWPGRDPIIRENEVFE